MHREWTIVIPKEVDTTDSKVISLWKASTGGECVWVVDENTIEFRMNDGNVYWEFSSYEDAERFAFDWLMADIKNRKEN